MNTVDDRYHVCRKNDRANLLAIARRRFKGVQVVIVVRSSRMVQLDANNNAVKPSKYDSVYGTADIRRLLDGEVLATYALSSEPIR